MKPIRILFLRSIDRGLYIRVQLNTLGRKLEEKFVLSDPRVEFRGLASFGSLTTLEWDRDVGRDEQGKLNFARWIFLATKCPVRKID